jgi:hypothetical protein
LYKPLGGVEKGRIPKKVLGLSIGFILPSKATGANFYRKTALGGMYKVGALRI